MKKIIKADETLNKDLQAVLDELKNTPLEEKKLALIAEDKDIFEIVVDIWDMKCSKLNRDDYTNDELELFFTKLYNKVFGFTDADGILKSTENTDELKPLSYFESAEVKTAQKKINSAMVELQKLRGKLNEAENIDEAVEEIMDLSAKRDTLLKDLDDTLLKGIDTEKMSKWEKSLTVQTRQMLINDPSKTKMGKSGKS